MQAVGTNDLSQVAFQAINDDASEASGGSPIAGLNVNWEQATDTNFWIRVLVDCVAPGNRAIAAWLCEYNHNGTGYNNFVTGTSSVIKSVASAFITSGDDTTEFSGNRIGVGTWADVTNNATKAGGEATGPTTMMPSTEMELLWNLQVVGTDVSGGDTIDLRWRVLFASNVEDFTFGYANTPTITVPADPPTLGFGCVEAVAAGRNAVEATAAGFHAVASSSGTYLAVDATGKLNQAVGATIGTKPRVDATAKGGC